MVWGMECNVWYGEWNVMYGMGMECNVWYGEWNVMYGMGNGM